jgi:hypothetical protein
VHSFYQQNLNKNYPYTFWIVINAGNGTSTNVIDAIYTPAFSYPPVVLKNGTFAAIITIVVLYYVSVPSSTYTATAS